MIQTRKMKIIRNRQPKRKMIKKRTAKTASKVARKKKWQKNSHLRKKKRRKMLGPYLQLVMIRLMDLEGIPIVEHKADTNT